MKPITLFFKIVFILFCFANTVNAQTSTNNRKKLWTVEQMIAIAKKYNFEDSVLLPRFNSFFYFEKNMLEYYLKTNSAVALKGKEWSEYMRKTQYVKTMEDHSKLVESLPTVKTSIAKMFGGEKDYDDYLKLASQFKWRIYRIKEGAVTFVRSDEPISLKELQYGARIDTLPRQ